MNRRVLISIVCCAASSAAYADVITPGPPEPSVTLPLTLSALGLAGMLVLIARRSRREQLNPATHQVVTAAEVAGRPHRWRRSWISASLLPVSLVVAALAVKLAPRSPSPAEKLLLILVPCSVFAVGFLLGILGMISARRENADAFVPSFPPLLYLLSALVAGVSLLP